jgi:hypothetical protein
MSIQFRNSRLNRSYLSRVAASVGPAKPQVAADDVRAPVKSNGHVAAPARDAATGQVKDASVLEICHPEIARAVSLLWGFPEMNHYFDRLWMADETQGPIDPGAMSDLMLLSRVHQNLIPGRPTRSMANMDPANRLAEGEAAKDLWGDVPPRR